MRNSLFLLLLLAISFSSCKRFLDIEPKGSVPDDITIYDKTSAQTALNGAYRQLGSQGYYGENFVTLGYFPSGDIQNNTTGGAANLVNVNFRSDDANFNTSWNAIYNAINRANHVITKVPSIPSNSQFSEELKKQIIAEAKFIRAVSYFDLARGWGGVQIFLTPTADVKTRPVVARSTIQQTYEQVLKDLTEAEADLPESNNRIRATKQSARALRARLHLYKKDWTDAVSYASKLIDDKSNYELVKPFSAWFLNNVTGTKESIFEIQYSAQNQSSLRAQMQHPSKGGTYRYAPNDRFVALLKDPDISGGRKALIDSVKQGNTTLWFGNLYYRNPATDPSYVLRIAEMYLIRAEAYTQLDKLQEGLDDLNLIRGRSNVPLLQLGQDVTTKEDVLEAIEAERRIEFAWEGHRWFDLARTGRAKTVLEALDPKTKVDAWEYVFPIPVTQTQLDPALIQNPGY